MQQPSQVPTAKGASAGSGSDSALKLPPIVVGPTTSTASELAKANTDDGPGIEINKETRTIVGSIRHDANTNTWRLRHIGNNDDDQKVSELILKGIEPYSNSLRDRMTVSIRGELTNRTKNSEISVTEVNIIGQ